jgi:16S rRNA (cytidine1402-2'-O)-methyltransferase
MGTLYLVATPIGNLEDMSPRAIRILREASLIAAEDTRHTGKLLKHFEIETPLTSYFEHNKLEKLDFILDKPTDVALVSDAGVLRSTIRATKEGCARVKLRRDRCPAPRPPSPP